MSLLQVWLAWGCKHLMSELPEPPVSSETSCSSDTEESNEAACAVFKRLPLLSQAAASIAKDATRASWQTVVLLRTLCLHVAKS